MCYLVAKDRDAHGCFALKTKHGKHLVELKKGTESGGWVSGRTAGNDQQTNGLWGICTISLRGYGAGVSNACKGASAVRWLIKRIDKKLGPGPNVVNLTFRSTRKRGFER